MFPVFLSPRGSRNATLLSSPSTLSEPNPCKASAKDPFDSPKPFELVFGPICPVTLSVVDWVLGVFVLTRSAHDLGGALGTGDAAFEVSSDVFAWFASVFVVESS